MNGIFIIIFFKDMAQYFEINKNATLPSLRLEVINDGRNDFGKLYLALQGSSSVTFTMTNTATGIKKIAKAKAYVVYDEDSDCEERYFIEYRWKKRDTNESGTYTGHFHIDFQSPVYMEGVTFPQGELIVPIAEDLIILVNDSMIKK